MCALQGIWIWCKGIARERIEGVFFGIVANVLVDTLGSMDLQSRGMAQSMRL